MSDRKVMSKVHYDKLAAKYDQHPHATYLAKLSPLIVARAEAWSADSVADVGCGTGSLMALLREAGLKVAGVDISSKMIELARDRLGEEADLRVADSESLPWEDDSFSLVVCVGSFHHYPAPLRALAEMRRVLRSNGYLIIADPTLPIVVRQLANLFIGLSGEGATKIYSESELGSMMRVAHFADVEPIDVNSSAIVLGASANKKGFPGA